MTEDKKPARGDIEGEGSYEAAGRYNAKTAQAAKDKGQVTKDAKAAAQALDGAESDDLKKAEKEGKSHARN